MVGTWYLVRIGVVGDARKSFVTDVERRTGRQAPSMGRCGGVSEVESVLLSFLRRLLSHFERPASWFSDKVLQLNLKVTELPLLPF